MDKRITTTGNRTLQVSSQNWQQSWDLIPVKADTSPAELLQLNLPALSQLGKNAVGGMAGVTAFKMQFTNLVEFVDAKMNDGQIRECSELAYEEYHWFTLAELKQFILRVKTGVYTSHKNFSALVLMEFLKQYADERLEHRYNHYSQLKPQPRRQVVLSIEPLTGKSRKVAEWLCRQYQIRAEEYIRRMKDIIQRTADNMGQPVRDIMDEEEYKRIRSEYMTKQMQQKAKQETDENRNP